MSAFKSPWSDIDETYPGQPYVVDSNGWGWFAIFIIVALPFCLIWSFLDQLADAICEHPYIAVIIYLFLSFALSYFVCRSKTSKTTVLDFLAVVIALLPIAWVQGVYAIPYVLTKDGFFWVTVEWLLVTAAIVGVTVFVIAVSSKLKNGIVQIVVAVVYFVIVKLIVGPPGDLTVEAVKQMYNLI